MAYDDEKKHASDAYRAQVDADPSTRPRGAPKGRRGAVGWVVALVIVAALVIGVSLFGNDDAPDTGQPAAMAPAEDGVAPTADLPAGTGQDPVVPGSGD
ncbi:hypothetical protein ATI53_10704 [Salipiger aestuarii]|uniref:Uncharacterized protein n=1 Tax=Salipiger aestuarii TaxID=568098 RepID=A0A327XNB7_9RHOB|nr:hypothetical protein [Salipiger aestuarii]RAK09426.1 hypothetical protein ATI53_10704 [Salipiger aestuarii]